MAKNRQTGGAGALPKGNARTARAYTPLEKTAATAVFDWPSPETVVAARSPRW
jgi:hypothetical protein